MLAKLNPSGSLIYPPKRLTINGCVVFNPTDEMLTAEGFKTLIESTQPSNGEGFYYVPSYSETDESITQSWTKVEYTPEPDYYGLGQALLEGIDYELS